METNRGPIVIATAYLPPRRPVLPSAEFSELNRLTKPVYFLGDLNARHWALGHRNNNQVGDFVARMIQNGESFHLGPEFPTLIRANTATTPDIVLGNADATLNLHLRAGPISTSDHLPIVATISTNPLLIDTAIYRDNVNRADWEGMQRQLQSLPVTTNLRDATLQEIDQEVDKWYADLLNAKDRFIPKSRYKRQPCPRPTQEITQLQTMFSHVLTLAQTRGWTPELRNRYSEIRLDLREKWTAALRDQWQRFMAQTETKYNNPKDFWTAIRKLSGKEYVPDTYLLNDQNEKVWSVREKEALHRRFWTDKFRITEEENENFDQEFELEVETLLENQRELTQPSQTADFSKLEYDNPLTRRITPREVKAIIKSFKNGKAPGGTGVNKAILEKLPNKMVARLCNIFNASLAAGYFPRKFRHAIIRLIPKPGKTPHKVESNRPISLLETPGKSLEKIINKRIIDHLQDHDLYNNRQHGFRQGRGTHTAIGIVYESASIALADRVQTNVVLRDVAKAFDKVWHPGLKLKLTRLDLPACLVQFCCSFLDDRTARIKLGQYLGESIQLESGVPQGSCLSPTLYTIYTGDMPDPIVYSEYVAYADDITQIITYPGKSRNMMARVTARAIESINEFEKKWKIATNMTKFQVIPLARTALAPLIVEGEQIEYSNKGKVLGLKIGKRGIIPHVNERIQSANRQLTKIKRFGLLPEGQKAHLYKALIRPILEYPPIPLDTISTSQKLRLQRVQNKAVRWIKGFTPPYTETVEDMHMELGLDPLNVRIHRMSRRAWQRIEAHDNETYQRLSEAEPRGTHAWWPRSLTGVEPPDDMYV